MPQLYVRSDVWSLKPDDPVITFYATAVAAMQAKPATDPTSWSYQAAIHGTYATPLQDLWNECRHGTWYFLSWHRMYLYYFERIVRQQVIEQGGPASWALPYWDYDGGNSDNTLPAAFRDPANRDGSPNPLYVEQRAPGINDGAGLPRQVTSPAAALSRVLFTGASEFGGGETSPLGQFWSSTGRLEATPHNAVHVAVGGPGGLMSDPDTAAQDPVFWLHHANIDRLWWAWRQQPGRADPAGQGWLGQAFSFFDADGAKVSLTGAGVEDITGQLGYTYEQAAGAQAQAAQRERIQVNWPAPWPSRPQEPAGPAAAGPEPARDLLGASERPTRLVGDTVTVPIAIDERAARSLAAAPGAARRQHRAFLDLEDITAERNPGLVYGIYVNLPGQPAQDDLADHHVGNLAPFGVERARDPRGNEHGHGLRESIDITGLLDRLAREGKWQDGSQVTVTLSPITLQPPAGRPEAAADLAPAAHADRPISIGRMSVHYA
jgi:tyrosinase